MSGTAGTLHEAIDRRQESAQKYNIQSTPTFIIGNTRIQGARPFEVFKKVLDPMIAAAPAKKPAAAKPTDDKPAAKPAANKDGDKKDDKKGGAGN